jgi:hypothetical protein
MVVSQHDATSIDGKNVGSIKFKDKILTSNCSW